MPFREALQYSTEVFLDAALRGAGFSVSARERSVLNSNIVGSLLETEIAIKRSPIAGIGFASVLRGASNVAIGPYLSMQAAGEATSLMFVTVPSGILVVCSAAGIGKALEKGLNRQISAIFEGKTPPILRKLRAKRARRR